MDLAELRQLAERERQTQKNVRIRCCTAASCLASHGLAVKDALVRAVADGGRAPFRRRLRRELRRLEHPPKQQMFRDLSCGCVIHG